MILRRVRKDKGREVTGTVTQGLVGCSDDFDSYSERDGDHLKSCDQTYIKDHSGRFVEN